MHFAPGSLHVWWDRVDILGRLGIFPLSGHSTYSSPGCVGMCLYLCHTILLPVRGTLLTRYLCRITLATPFAVGTARLSTDRVTDCRRHTRHILAYNVQHHLLQRRHILTACTSHKEVCISCTFPVLSSERQNRHMYTHIYTEILVSLHI